jgi:SAM-dependent methyltransferase
VVLSTALSIDIARFLSVEDYATWAATHTTTLERRRQIEDQLIQDDSERFFVAGHCFPCDRRANFVVDYQYQWDTHNGRRIPNWRERLECLECGLNNRMRAAIHLFEREFSPNRNARLYVTEQTTPLFQVLSRSYPTLTGSEFLGSAINYGTSDHSGIRNESIVKLTFSSDLFDFILSFDVLEHVPEYLAGFRECWRCLSPGGKILFTVPFDPHMSSNLVRARVDRRGGIEHLAPPEYHGDPLSSAGCLSYYTFGWELLNAVRAVGFTDVSALSFWSSDYGYLGRDQIVFVAHKPS